MREKPDLQDEIIANLLHEQYGLRNVTVDFQPKGEDINAAVYRVIAEDGTLYFMKLLRGAMDESSLAVPAFLHQSGIPQIIAPIAAVGHQLWTRLEGYHVILYPFIEGHNAFEIALTPRQWVDFGAALRSIHKAALPTELGNQVQQENYSAEWRERVKQLLVHPLEKPFVNSIAAQTASFLTNKSEEILYFVRKAEQLSSVLQAQGPEFVLCHSDIHAGNLLIDRMGRLYIIDWDHPILAPKERDLMFINGGVGSAWNLPQEEANFYEGYGRMDGINPVALAYYRFERILRDIAEWGELLLLTDVGGEDRLRWFQGFLRWFSPSDVVEMACKAERTLPPELRSHSF